MHCTSDVAVDLVEAAMVQGIMKAAIDQEAHQENVAGRKRKRDQGHARADPGNGTTQKNKSLAPHGGGASRQQGIEEDQRRENSERETTAIYKRGIPESQGRSQTKVGTESQGERQIAANLPLRAGLIM